MCSIVQLLAGTSIDFNYLFNAMHNNEHGWGVLMKENGKIHVRKELPEKVDVEGFYKYLEDNKDVERWFHLRNASAGEISKDNVQPIQVYHSSKRDVFFMHNGTIYGNVLLPEAQKPFVNLDLTDTKISDSKKFAMSKIAPILLRMKGENGTADIHDPFIQEVIYAKWQHGHGRAVLVSSDQPSLLLNSSSWEKIKNKDGTEFLASNDEYFKELKRGTLFNQRKAEEEKNKPKTQITVHNSSFNNKGGRQIHEIQYPPFHNTISLSDKIVDILEEYDLYSHDGFIAMAGIELSELKKLFRENLNDACKMFMYLTSYLKDYAETNENLTKELAKANYRLQEFKTEEVNVQKGGTEVHVG